MLPRGLDDPVDAAGCPSEANLLGLLPVATVEFVFFFFFLRLVYWNPRAGSLPWAVLMCPYLIAEVKWTVRTRRGCLRTHLCRGLIDSALLCLASGQCIWFWIHFPFLEWGGFGCVQSHFEVSMPPVETSPFVRLFFCFRTCCWLVLFWETQRNPPILRYSLGTRPF